MIIRKTEKAFWTIVYHEGKRIAEFVKGEFETDDKTTAKILNIMGYEIVGGLKAEPTTPKSKKD